MKLKKTLGFKSEFATRTTRKSFMDLEMVVYKHVIVVVFCAFFVVIELNCNLVQNYNNFRTRSMKILKVCVINSLYLQHVYLY